MLRIDYLVDCLIQPLKNWNCRKRLCARQVLRPQAGLCIKLMLIFLNSFFVIGKSALPKVSYNSFLVWAESFEVLEDGF